MSDFTFALDIFKSLDGFIEQKYIEGVQEAKHEATLAPDDPYFETTRGFGPGRCPYDVHTAAGKWWWRGHESMRSAIAAAAHARERYLEQLRRLTPPRD